MEKTTFLDSIYSVQKDRKTVLSLLWIFAMFNYLYADVLTLMDPVQLRRVYSDTGPFPMTEGFLLGGAILMETAMVMIVISKFVDYRVNRWANITASILHTSAVFGSMFTGTPALYYLFFGIIEMGCTIFIFFYALKWKVEEKNI